MNWMKFLKLYNEWLTLPLALVIFFVFPEFIRHFDPSAGAYDAGIFHGAIYAIAVFCLFSGFSWLMMWFNFPELKKYLDDKAETDLIDGGYSIAAITAFAIYFGYILILFLILNSL
jgi:hypothetical protein